MSNPRDESHVPYPTTSDQSNVETIAQHTASEPSSDLPQGHDATWSTSGVNIAAASSEVSLRFEPNTSSATPSNEHAYPPPPSISDTGDFTTKRRYSMQSDSRSIGSSVSNTTNASVITILSRDAARDQRANFLASRYGLTLSSNFPSERNQALGTNRTDPLQRVQKSARLRMHATCHMCNTPFLASSTCPKCDHKRCNACPRAASKGVQALSDQTKQRFDLLPHPSEQTSASAMQIHNSGSTYHLINVYRDTSLTV